MLVVSDIHFELGYHHGTYQYPALEWLLGKIRMTKPDVLLGLGDWGTGWKDEDWEAVVSLSQVRAIYGNHENMESLRSARNTDGTSVLMRDGEVLTFDGLKFGLINGVMAERLERLKPVPRKCPRDFLHFARSLVGVDVLCTHESPRIPALETRIHKTVATDTMNDVLEIVKPKVILSGHVGRSYNLSRLGPVLSLIVDSSQAARHFAIFEPASRELEIWNDNEIVEKTAF